MMKNWLIYVMLLPLMAIFLTACEDEVSYSDMKDKEQDAINKFMTIDGVCVISQAQFVLQNYTTNVDRNEYVLLDDVYVQFVKNPFDAQDARRIEDGESMNLLVRYTEYNVMEGSILSTNEQEQDADEMTVTNDSGSFTAALSSGVMVNQYGTSAVPSGWLVVMPYLYFTRSTANLAEVNLIVPHTAGTSLAATYVYPCFYNITFQPER